MAILSFSSSERMAGVLWQSRLRQSVRLYLAFADDSCDRQQVEACLRIVEKRLVEDLLLPHPVGGSVPLTLDEAWQLVELAQEKLLGSAAGAAATLSQFSLEQVLHPLRQRTTTRHTTHRLDSST